MSAYTTSNARVFVAKYTCQDHSTHEMLCIERNHDRGRADFDSFANSVKNYCSSTVTLVSTVLAPDITPEQVMLD